MSENIVTIYTEAERDLLTTRKGYKSIWVYTFCKHCNQKYKVQMWKLMQNGFICKKCKISQTKLNFSEEHKLQINNKRKETCKQIYGVENVFQHETTKNKIVETLQQKYGVSNAQQLKGREVVKTEKPKVENKTEDFLEEHFEELKNSQLTKWELRTDEQRNEILQKRKRTNKRKYGVEFAQQTEEVQRHYKQNSLKKWGVEYPTQNPEVYQKIENTFRERYGSNHPNFCFEYDNQMFDSSWELVVWIYAQDHNESIKREPTTIEYEYEGVLHRYYPDFNYKGQLIEVKGPQFFENGKLINPFDRSLDSLYEVKYKAALDGGVSFWHYEDVKPFLDYVEQTYTKDYINLFSKKLPFPYPKLSTGTDDDLIRYFHKSIYEASKKDKLSPLQAWQDKNLIKKSALNRLKYVKRCKPSDVLQGFSVAHIAPKISVFKTKKAEELIQKYLSDFSNIFDPFSGFSGRMLGTTNLGKKYIGQDINEKHVQESNEIIQFKKIQDSATVIQQDILKDSYKEFECLFTCPPYGGKEHWNENNDEVEKSCDEWIDVCLKNYKCKRYLFVVDQTEKYKDYIVDEIINKSHLGTNKELVLLINTDEK